MFPMIIRATSRGRTYEYVHLCESIWKNGRSLRRTVVSLGRKDILDAHLDRIYEICRGHKPASPDDPVPLSSFHLGPFLVLRRLWDELGLPQRLGALADRVLVLVLNRLTRPSSEHALADWLTAFFACDSQGRRFAPAFLSDAQRAAAKNPRVKVQAFQLQRWYRTLDALLPLKDELEQHLFDRFRHLFALQCDLVFYDLTSTYFEGLGPAELARHGYSRDKRPANPQILVGVAMVDGLPVSHTVFAGNRKDSTTVQGVIRDLRARFGLGRFVFVGDRGMKSESSVAAVEEEGLGYLMAVQGRRNPVMDAALVAVKEDGWVACEGWDRQPKKNGSQVQEVTGKGSETRRFLVHSPERERHERKLRKKEQAKVRKRLERLRERVAGGEFLRRAAKEWKRRAGKAGREKAGKAVHQAAGRESEEQEREARKQEREAEERKLAASLIGESAGRILGANHGHRYYEWRLDEAGQLEYGESANCEQERRREGHWLLETEEPELGAVEAVRAYQDLWRVEAAFRTMKDVLELRPVWHRTEERVRAHVLVASLALAIDRVLERKLRKAGLQLSTRAAWEALERVNLVEFEMKGKAPKRGVCVNSEEARKVLRALGVKAQAPQPPAEGELTVH